MPGKTIAEKILSNHSGVDAHAGDIVVADLDFVLGQDGTSPLAIRALGEMGVSQLFDPNKVALIMDHSSPSPIEGVSALHTIMRNFGKATGPACRWAAKRSGSRGCCSDLKHSRLHGAQGCSAHALRARGLFGVALRLVCVHWKLHSHPQSAYSTGFCQGASAMPQCNLFHDGQAQPASARLV